MTGTLSLVVVLCSCRDNFEEHLQHTVVMDHMGDHIMTWTPYEIDVVFEISVSTRRLCGDLVVI